MYYLVQVQVSECVCDGGGFGRAVLCLALWKCVLGSGTDGGFQSRLSSCLEHFVFILFDFVFLP